jgi:hypothetical protein
MIFTHSLLWRDVAEYMSLLLIGSSHAPLDALCAISLQNFRVFSSLLEPWSAGRSGLSHLLARLGHLLHLRHQPREACSV